MITQTVDLNLIPNSAPVVIHCDQYDTGTGRLIFNLYNEYVAYSPVGTAVIQGTKPDNHGFNYNCTMVGNVVTADLTAQMSIVAGRVRCQIVVTESSGRTGSFAFILDVQKSALPANSDMSASDYQLIQQAINDTAQYASDAEDSAEDAEAWAVGERNGVPVTSGDPTYENNAKYWSNYSGTLTHLSDVTISAPQDDQVLTYDANTAQWVNAAAGGVPALSSLPDVHITTVSDGQALRYDSNSGKWINEAVADDITDLSDVTISAPTDGQALVYDSSDQEWKNETITATTTLGNLTDVSLSSVQDGQALVYDSNSTSWKNKKIIDADAVHWEDNSILGAKNLLRKAYNTSTIYGITFTVNDNGSIVASGVATSEVYWSVYNYSNTPELQQGSYIVSGGVAKTDNYSFYLHERNAGNTGWGSSYVDTTGNGVLYTRTTDVHYAILIYIKSGTDLTTPITFYPMIRLATDTDDTYQPYSMTNRELTDKVNGMVDYVNTTANNGSAYTGSLDDAPLGYTYCSSGCTNNPVHKWGVTETIKASSTAKIQKFYSVETDDYCIRKMVSSTWQAWQKVTTTSVS